MKPESSATHDKTISSLSTQNISLHSIPLGNPKGFHMGALPSHHRVPTPLGLEEQGEWPLAPQALPGSDSDGF